MNIAKVLLVSLVSCILITGCAKEEGSSSGSGGASFTNTSVTVDAGNKNVVAKATSIASAQAIKGDSAPGARALLDQSKFAFLTKPRTLGQTRAIQTEDVSDYLCLSGGSAVYQYDTDNFTQDRYSFSYVYDQCNYTFGDYSVVTDGTGSLEYDNGITTTEFNLTITTNDETYTMSGTWTCSDMLDCTFDEEFSVEGVDYQVSNVEVSGNTSSGFNISGRINHSDLGYVDFVATGLVQCTDGGFESGNIVITDSTSSEVVSITFVSCTEMTITFNNVSETVAQ